MRTQAAGKQQHKWVQWSRKVSQYSQVCQKRRDVHCDVVACQQPYVPLDGAKGGSINYSSGATADTLRYQESSGNVKP
jgi:hypothetical protein